LPEESVGDGSGCGGGAVGCGQARGFQLDDGVVYLGDKYQKAVDSQATVYESKGPAGEGGTTSIMDVTSSDVFLKMITSAAGTFQANNCGGNSSGAGADATGHGTSNESGAHRQGNESTWDGDKEGSDSGVSGGGGDTGEPNGAEYKDASPRFTIHVALFHLRCKDQPEAKVLTLDSSPDETVGELKQRLTQQSSLSHEE